MSKQTRDLSRRRASGRLLAVLLLALLPVVGCGDTAAEEAAAAEATRQAEFAGIKEAKAALDAKRQELSSLREQAVAASSAGGDEAATAAPDPTQIQALEQEIATDADELGGRVVTLLNEDPLIEGEPPSERQKELIAIKSDEDIALAREYIEKGGDYRGAIEIYNRALSIDPDNEKIREELAKAERDRFMSEERFKLAKKGMTQDEVRALLGQVNSYNIKEYPEKNVVAWFYPREGGAAAGVFFEKKKDVFVVYQLNFEAVKRKGEEPEEGPAT